MNSAIHLALKTTPPQAQRLIDLQREFAAACNELAPMAQQTRCWNRVALHHMAYKALRQRFPNLGSQMVCNAIYSVSRACRHVYQHPRSPFNLQRLGGKPLPRLQFQPEAPVCFDRHTLSIKDGQVSMFTLDGRMRFQLDLAPADEQRFRDSKLREIVLTSANGPVFRLSFYFADPEDNDTAPDSAEMPEYVLVVEDPLPTPLAFQPDQPANRLPS
jgi:hypothetical protein